MGAGARAGRAGAGGARLDADEEARRRSPSAPAGWPWRPLDGRKGRWPPTWWRGAPRLRELPRGGAWLFVETGGDSPAEALSRARDICRTARRP